MNPYGDIFPGGLCLAVFVFRLKLMIVIMNDSLPPKLRELVSSESEYLYTPLRNLFSDVNNFG